MPLIATNSVLPISIVAPQAISCAVIARKPGKLLLKPKPKSNVGSGDSTVPPPPIKHSMNIGTWDEKESVVKAPPTNSASSNCNPAASANNSNTNIYAKPTALMAALATTTTAATRPSATGPAPPHAASTVVAARSLGRSKE